MKRESEIVCGGVEALQILQEGRQESEIIQRLMFFPPPKGDGDASTLHKIRSGIIPILLILIISCYKNNHALGRKMLSSLC